MKIAILNCDELVNIDQAAALVHLKQGELSAVVWVAARASGRAGEEESSN